DRPHHGQDDLFLKAAERFLLLDFLLQSAGHDFSLSCVTEMYPAFIILLLTIVVARTILMRYFGGGPMAETTTWQIDPAHSAVEFAVKHMMFTTVRGRLKDVKGTIEVDEKRPDRSSVNVEIGAASIDTGVADRDGHLRS